MCFVHILYDAHICNCRNRKINTCILFNLSFLIKSQMFELSLSLSLSLSISLSLSECRPIRKEKNDFKNFVC